MKYLIRIRWNCGTERYVTGYSEDRSVVWEPGHAAMVFSDKTAETALDISIGLNFNQLSGDLGGFSHVEVLKDNWEIPVNPSEEDEKLSEYYRLGKLIEVVDDYEKDEKKEQMKVRFFNGCFEILKGTRVLIRSESLAYITKMCQLLS
jgi:hypothetical protein